MDHAATKEVYARLAENSVAIPSAEADRLGAHARDLGVVLVIGVNERVERGPGNGSLYNSSLTYDATGQLVNHHRKLMPTYTERLIWGQGDGAGLRAVDTAAGRLSSLVCWEHWMPLARQALHDSGEQIHVALWPTVKEMHQVASRQYAFEGRCFVLAAGSILLAEDTPPELTLPDELAAAPQTPVLRGGSAIIAPDGAYLAGPLWDEEGILHAELDLRAITREQNGARCQRPLRAAGCLSLSGAPQTAALKQRPAKPIPGISRLPTAPLLRRNPPGAARQGPYHRAGARSPCAPRHRDRRR